MLFRPSSALLQTPNVVHRTTTKPPSDAVCEEFRPHLRLSSDSIPPANRYFAASVVFFSFFPGIDPTRPIGVAREMAWRTAQEPPDF